MLEKWTKKLSLSFNGSKNLLPRSAWTLKSFLGSVQWKPMFCFQYIALLRVLRSKDGAFILTVVLVEWFSGLQQWHCCEGLGLGCQGLALCFPLWAPAVKWSWFMSRLLKSAGYLEEYYIFSTFSSPLHPSRACAEITRCKNIKSSKRLYCGEMLI